MQDNKDSKENKDSKDKNANWFDYYFDLGKKNFKNYDELEGEIDPQFEKDPDNTHQPKQDSPDWLQKVRQWQSDIASNFGWNNQPKPPEKALPEKIQTENALPPVQNNQNWFFPTKVIETKPAPAPAKNLTEKSGDLVGTWMKRYALRQFGIGAPSINSFWIWQNTPREIPELDEAISGLESYQQRMQKKATRASKRLEQLKAERNRLLQLQQGQPQSKPKSATAKPTVEDNHPLDQR